MGILAPLPVVLPLLPLRLVLLVLLVFFPNFFLFVIPWLSWLSFLSFLSGGLLSNFTHGNAQRPARPLALGLGHLVGLPLLLPAPHLLLELFWQPAFVNKKSTWASIKPQSKGLVIS